MDRDGVASASARAADGLIETPFFDRADARLVARTLVGSIIAYRVRIVRRGFAKILRNAAGAQLSAPVASGF